MPEHASRFSAALYDQQNEHPVADWGGDELFTRMPRPRAVDDAPPPRFQPSHAVDDAPSPRFQPALALVDAPTDRRRAAADGARPGARDRRRSLSAAEAVRERAERLGLTVVAEPDPPAHEAIPPTAAAGWDPAAWEAATQATMQAWDNDPATEERAPNGRRTKLITGRPEGPPRPLSLAPAQRRRPARTPAEWIGPRPERIMAWAFVLGLVLILIAISTADAATL